MLSRLHWEVCHLYHLQHEFTQKSWKHEELFILPFSPVSLSYHTHPYLPPWQRTGWGTWSFPPRFETEWQVLGITFTLYNIYPHRGWKFCIDPGSLPWWTAQKLIPLPAKGVDSRITTVHRSSAGPFLRDGFWYCCPFAFSSKPAFFSEEGSILGYLPKFDQKLIRDWKITATGQEAGKSRCGHGAGAKMWNIAILIKITPRCSYCYVPGTELRVSSTRRLEKQVTPPQQLQRSDQICKESYNGSYPLHPQVTALYACRRTEENQVLLILSGRFSCLQRGRSVLASKGVRQKAPSLTHLKPVINTARKGTESWLTLHCHC